MRFIYNISFLLFLLLAGCSEKLDSIYVDNLDKQFKLSFKEDLASKSSNIIFSFELDVPYHCTNATISSEIKESIQPNTTGINIEGILEDGPCISGESTLPTDIVLRLLPDKYGKHEFYITIGDKVDNVGTLHIKENKFEFLLDDEETKTIIVDQSEVYFIPDSLVWGYLEIEDAFYLDIANQVQSEIEDLLGQVNLENGNFGHFLIKNNNIFLEQNPPVLTMGIFGKSKQLTTSELFELVNTKNEEYKGKFKMNLFSWDGEQTL